MFDLIHAHNVEHITLSTIVATLLLKKPIVCKIPTSGDISRITEEDVAHFSQWKTIGKFIETKVRLFLLRKTDNDHRYQPGNYC